MLLDRAIDLAGGDVCPGVELVMRRLVLRWHVQHGLAAVAKSVHSERIAANLDVFHFALSEADMAALDALDQGEVGRGVPNPDSFAWVPDPAAAADPPLRGTEARA